MIPQQLYIGRKPQLKKRPQTSQSLIFSRAKIWNMKETLAAKIRKRMLIGFYLIGTLALVTGMRMIIRFNKNNQKYPS